MHVIPSNPSIVQKLWRLLAKERRRAFLGLFGMMLISMALEILGVGLVVPALALILQSDLPAKYPVLTSWLNDLDNPSHEQLVVAAMLTMVVLYAIKALFLAFLAWRQARFVSLLQVEFSQTLFVGYLRQPYSFHLQRNSSQLIHTIASKSGTVAGAFQQSNVFLTELLVIGGISLTLLVVEPLGALLVMSTFALAAWSFNQVTRSRILRWGEAIQIHEALRFQTLQEGLGGAKDVKLLGRERDFFDRYNLHNARCARIAQHQGTLIALPRLWLELLAVTGLAGLVLTMIWQGRPVEVLLPTLGLFAAAAFRLMPSVNRVMSAVQGLRFVVPAVDTLYEELALLKGAEAPVRDQPLPFNKELVLDGIDFAYPSAGLQALRGVKLSIRRGTSVGFIGGSGAGKSTLVDILLGLLKPDGGTVKIDGADVQLNLRGWQDQIGYVPQSIFLTDDTLRRNVAFGLPNDQIDESAVWRAIRAAQLEQFVSELPQGLDTVVGERGIRLSGGQRQRIGIARALYHDPTVLVLDEATSSLDTATERDVMDAVRILKGDKTLIIVAHRLSTVEHCDFIFRLEHGQLVDEGRPAAVLGIA